MSSGVDGRLLSFFTPGKTHSRHVVLRDKERIVARRHGALLRSGEAMLPNEATLCATCWMHGVFGAQLTIGNTSFHKLFSVSRDPYNITRGSGLRMLVDIRRRMAAADRAVRLRDRPRRLPLDLSARRQNHHGLGDRFRRRTRHAMARDRRRRTTAASSSSAISSSASTNSHTPLGWRSTRAKAIRLPAGSRWTVGPALSARRLSSCDQHAREHRSRRRRRTALCRRQAPQRRLRRDPDVPDERIRLRCGRFDDRSEARGGAGGQICRPRR